jgi:hypothetical protein
MDGDGREGVLRRQWRPSCVISERWQLTAGRVPTIGKDEGSGESRVVWLG